MINLKKILLLNLNQKQIIKINNNKITIGIMAYKNNSKNQEIIDLTKSLNIFYEEIVEEIEIEDFLNNIKNKHLNYFENKVVEDYKGTYLGDFENDKKEGYEIMLYTDGRIYFGNWINDVPEGNGIFIDGLDKHIGEWKNDNLMSGETNLNIFGNYKINNEKMKENYNFLIFLKYEGTMDKDELYGKLTTKNDTIYEGKF